MVLNRAATGIPISKEEEPITIDFHSIDSSLERSESFNFLFLESFCNDDFSSCIPISLSANISASK